MLPGVTLWTFSRCACCRCRALNNEATLAVTLQQTTSQVSTELADLCCENHTLYCENQALMQVRRQRTHGTGCTQSVVGWP